MLRIRKTRWKLLFIAAAVALSVAVNALLTLSLPDPARLVVNGVVSTLLFLAGARVFRGRGEAIAPPRAWWRMTARPTAGFVLAAWFTIGVVTGIVQIVADPAEPVADILSTVIGAVLPALYLNSSVRLVRHPPAVVDETAALPKWKPLKL